MAQHPASAAAQEILTLINTSPRTPSAAAIAKIISHHAEPARISAQNASALLEAEKLVLEFKRLGDAEGNLDVEPLASEERALHERFEANFRSVDVKSADMAALRAVALTLWEMTRGDDGEPSLESRAARVLVDLVLRATESAATMPRSPVSPEFEAFRLAQQEFHDACRPTEAQSSEIEEAQDKVASAASDRMYDIGKSVIAREVRTLTDVAERAAVAREFASEILEDYPDVSVDYMALRAVVDGALALYPIARPVEHSACIGNT